jgi:isopentenyldiphosphate isomerase
MRREELNRAEQGEHQLPADELLTIYDESLNEIGVVPRAEAHTLGLLHQVVHCWLIAGAKEGEWLYFQRRSLNASFSGLYDIAACGHVGVGESSEAAVIRETREEVGVVIRPERLEHIGSFRESFEFGSYLDNEISQVYLYSVDEGELSLGDEVDEMIRVSSAELRRYVDQSSAAVHGIAVGSEEPVTISTSQLIPHTKEYFAFVLDRVLSRRTGGQE